MYGTTTAMIGGKVRTLKFNINADIEFERLHGLSGKSAEKRAEIASQIGTIEYIRDAVYCALRAADLERGNEIDYNHFTVGDWITDLPQSELERIIQSRDESQPQTKPDKKKVK
jgi:hypothetical protein